MRLMKNRILALALCFAMLCALGAGAAARDTDFENALAEDLKSLGLFKGVSDSDFELDRTPTRTEALVMLLRLLGREDEALSGTWQHPFTDVADWAEKYVGYAYEKGLTSGVSATEFGSGGAASCKMYLSFALRALGFSDALGDFSWNDPYELAEACEILPKQVDRESFLRADVVMVSYAALSAKCKDGTVLWQKLVQQGAIDPLAYASHIDQYVFYPRNSLSRENGAAAYEAVMAQSGFTAENELFAPEYGKVVYGNISKDINQNEPKIYVIYYSSTTGETYHSDPTSLGAGRVVELPLPALTEASLAAPESISLGGKLGHEDSVVYSVTFKERLAAQDATDNEVLIHEAGTYYYIYTLGTGALTLRIYSADGEQIFENVQNLVK